MSASQESKAESLFAAFLEQRSSGEELDFESWIENQGSLQLELRELHARHAQLEHHFARVAEATAPHRSVTRRLFLHGGDHGDRYRIWGEIARGGQASILRVRDENLQRDLAMKVAPVPDRGGGAAVEDRTIGRFIEEAHVTGQLDHPGIVPVHELGVDSEERVYFTMKLVKGRTLRDVFKLVQEQREGWTTTRALGVLLKVCEAVGYAHSKRVIHRDLKPANIMVGRFGEVYVMDWGLARVLGAEDRRDIRIREPDTTLTSAVTSYRRGTGSADSPLLTMDGDVVGTPAYMSPEQARGEIDAMGPRSDVYSLGAILYQLLTGQVPYVTPGIRINNYAVWARVQEAGPQDVHELARDQPPELLSICEKAMSRAPSQRYENVGELADDLRAYLEGRVVRAHRTGTFANVGKWMQRNRGLAGTAVGATVVLGLVTAIFLVRLQREVHAKSNALEDLLATSFERDALSVGPVSIDLVRRADELRPAHPDNLHSMRAWTAEAESFARLCEALLGETEFVDSDVVTPDRVKAVGAALDRVNSALAGVHARIDVALGLGARTLVECAEAWERAAREVAADPRFRTREGDPFTLPPQLGLIPLQRDSGSGLWEFLVATSGEEPTRLDTGALEIDEHTGIILVLLPGSPDYLMGSDDFDQDSYMQTLRVRLDPYFMGKYEVTQGQWARIMGANPSAHPAGSSPSISGRPEGPYIEIGPTHPVENMPWTAATEFCRRLGLALPTEAQWEFGCRALTSTTFWFGDEVDYENVQENMMDGDRFPFTAPVGSLGANPFGLFDMHGNVNEFCVDDYSWSLGEGRDRAEDGPLTGRDPLGDRSGLTWKSVRGGHCRAPEKLCRSVFRGRLPQHVTGLFTGLRVARPLTDSQQLVDEPDEGD